MAGAWFGRGQIWQASEMWPLSMGASPYFVGAHTLFLYGLVPLITLAGMAAVLSPGVLMTLAIGNFRQWAELPGQSLALSLVVIGGGTSLLKLVVLPLTPAAFLWFLVGVDLVLLAWLLARPPTLRCAPMGSSEARRWAFGAALAWVLVAALTPKFFWENFNDDGVQALECGRLLSRSVLPVWAPGTFGMTGFPAISTLAFVYPVHWFVELFGPYEIAARLPHLLYLVVLFFSIISVIEMGVAARLGAGGECGIALSLVAYFLAMAFSDSYDPYSADMAEPAAMQTLMMAVFVCGLGAVLQRRFGWSGLFFLLTYLSAPNGGALLGFAAIAMAVARPTGWRSAAAALVLVLAIGGGLAVLWPRIAGPGEHSLEIMLRRLLYWTVTDARRLLFLVIPCGIVPAAALLAVRRQDGPARAAAALCLGYFLFYYSQAFVALHFFAPAMVLPLVVYWRMAVLRPQTQRRAVIWVVPAALAAIWFSIPSDCSVDQTSRALGRASRCLIGDAGGDYAAVLRRVFPLYRRAFPADYDIADPAHEWGGSPTRWLYYARREELPDHEVDFIAQPAAAAAPAGFIEIGRTASDALYARSRDAYRTRRFGNFRTEYTAWVYRLPRTTIFKHLGLAAGAYDVDVRPYLPGVLSRYATK